MEINFGNTIKLQTQSGFFDASHINVIDSNNYSKEGVLLTAKLDECENPHVRLQSSCLFSESFWATDCDCALQLRSSMDIVQDKGGVILYFYEEGRGAGLKNKFEAINLQQTLSYNTKKAYECLNIKIDNRNYEVASEILKKVIGGKELILLTNNPNKINGLEQEGIKISKIEPLLCGEGNPAIQEYLQEKKISLGHIIN